MATIIKVTDQQIEDAKYAGFTTAKPKKPKGTKKRDSDRRNPLTPAAKAKWIDEKYNPWAKKVIEAAKKGAPLRKKQQEIDEAFKSV